MQNTYAFTGREAGYLAELLDCVYKIRTIDGEEDDLLQDLINALDNGCRILIND